MEHFVLNTLVAYAVEKGFKQLKGEFIPTSKNEMVKDFYLNLGFSKCDNYWELDVIKYEEKQNEIKYK